MQAITMTAANRNCKFKKKSHQFIKFPSTWLDNSKFVENNQIFSFIIFILAPLGLCHPGRRHYSPTAPLAMPLSKHIEIDTFLLSKSAKEIMRLPSIPEALGLNFSNNIDNPDWDLRGFPHSLQVNVGIMLQVRPRPLYSTSFPSHYLLSSSRVAKQRFTTGRIFSPFSKPVSHALCISLQTQ